jgi:hypothetical protein
MEGEHSMNSTSFWPEKYNEWDNLEGSGVNEIIQGDQSLFTVQKTRKIF